ncbi:MAG TPA: hypothetical protein VGI61_12830 [Parafilimonas sp.]
MKKLHYILFVASIFGCSNNPSSSVIQPADTLIGLPYNAQYSSDFTIGSQANVLTVLNGYKAWETGDINALKNTLGDSMTAVFDDGTLFSAGRDSAASFLQNARNAISSIQIIPTDGFHFTVLTKMKIGLQYG